MRSVIFFTYPQPLWFATSFLSFQNTKYINFNRLSPRKTPFIEIHYEKIPFFIHHSRWHDATSL
jgi:hypothetical protein